MTTYSTVVRRLFYSKLKKMALKLSHNSLNLRRGKKFNRASLFGTAAWLMTS